MLKKIKGFLSRCGKRRPGRPDLNREIALAQQLRDMLSVARKIDLDVVMTIEVGKLKQGVILPSDGPESEWLYNFACGHIMALQAELETKANLVAKRAWGSFVHTDGRIEISGSEGP